jgi:Phosphodiester glycosidase
MAVPLVDGQASLVIYKDGTATVADWGRDARLSADVAAVRQNLKLIVDGGKVTPLVAADNYLIWGKTLGNTVLVWRSGVGATRDGALVYAAGKGLSVESLADVLQRAGAVRAMELDINSRWTSANYYQVAPGDSQVVSPTKLVPDMVRSATRFLVPDERDFIAVFIRSELLPGT